MTTIEERTEQEAAKALTRHNLQQAYDRLHEARVGVKNLRALALPAEVIADLADLANRIELSAWRIEARIRGDAA